MNQRSCGILLHLSSLPSEYGIGDCGPNAYRFVDFLIRAKQRVWQVLPLNPTDSAHANSPYSSYSAFAGNKLLISSEQLIEEGLIEQNDIPRLPQFQLAVVDFQPVASYKKKLHDSAWRSFRSRSDHSDFKRFCRQEAVWLDDFALFVLLKRIHHGVVWNKWPERLRDRHGDALEEIQRDCHGELQQIKFEQYLFFRQWLAVKRYANEQGVLIFGDIPIYINYDSADTWTNPQMFKLDEHKRPTVVAGVPPDYFSKTGQLWGNPIYDWDALKADGFQWWLKRLEHVFRLYDIVRIDHFRGLVAFWEVPAGQKTAVNGKWVEAPVDDFLTTIKMHFKSLPMVAEDLGIITEDVREAMKRHGLPGMKVLQFAFGEDNPNHPYLPRNYDENAVVYTGTHDNNTVVGWFNNEASQSDKRRLFAYLGGEVPVEKLPWVLIRLALRSRARLAVIPMQDLLGMPETARMNKPATRDHNWCWRLRPEQLENAPAGDLAELVSASGRG